MTEAPPLDVLIVGAGPTGLALATQLQAYGARFRIVDRSLDRARESRALAVQPRTLEALAPYGLSAELVRRGNPAVQLRMHAPGRTARLPLFDLGVADTPYPFLLCLSQAETESVLGDRLAERGAQVERGSELLGLTREDAGVVCRLRTRHGVEESVRARYVVGCDGSRSTVRNLAGIAFAGSAYPETFLLADLEVDGLEPGAAHAFMTDTGVVFFFPLGSPASWRMLAMKPPGLADPGTGTEAANADSDADVSLGMLQSLVDRYVSEPLRLRDPVWMTDFRIHCRGADRYRSGRLFVAGDAAHIHSPAGGQGMNTGIQDALNLGWKLALVCRGDASPALLDTYESERAPVGRSVLRFTHRAFTLATSRLPLIRQARTHLAPRLAPLVLRPRILRGAAFRALGQLSIRYRRSPATAAGPKSPRRGPRPGDRLPDTPHGLQALTAEPGYHLLLCGPPDAWNDDRVAAAVEGRAHLVKVHTPGAGTPWPGVAHCLVRPDGYIGYLASGTDTAGLVDYLDRWLERKA
ncbi:FAD-dependent monooxygenase [Streptomyces sp. NPDC051907]|uniref:FAD-dependent monooxygenase n=1 Tax=Streptomyces sp. NPDC051907 TaxID=3155284 RepID=UPI003419B60F